MDCVPTYYQNGHLRSLGFSLVVKPSKLGGTGFHYTHTHTQIGAGAELFFIIALGKALFFPMSALIARIFVSCIENYHKIDDLNNILQF